MQKNKSNKVMVTDHVLEVRYPASGTFLDVRGYIADYIRNHKYLPHWKIDSNVVNFRDEQDAIKLEGAFVGYKSAGYVVQNPQTHNFFTDRATAFWKLLIKNEHYKIPEPSRFGARTKLFIPAKQTFEEINKTLFESFFTEKARSLIGGKETDLQFVIDIKEDVFNVRVIIGPVHKEEAKKYFQFESEHFKKCGIFLDLDYYITNQLTIDNIPTLLKQSIELTWEKAEKIAAGLGF